MGFTSRISRYYAKSLGDRLAHLVGFGRMSDDSVAHFEAGGGLSRDVADRMSENVFSTHGLPLSMGLNFRINGQDMLVPMAVEEPSVVAAASNAARLVRLCGGFHGEATASVMTTQVQLDGVPNAAAAPGIIAEHRERLMALADAAIPNMVKRGGGTRDLEARVLDEGEGVVVLHLYVDVGDAMGANVVDTVAEAVAPQVQELLGGHIGLRILTNLSLRRMVKVHCEVSAEVLTSEGKTGDALADAIVRASRFAELDPFRATTHNKGIMNGVDAVAVALGQDWRSIEAGAHAFASMTGSYQPLATWTRTETGLRGELEMPLAVATVGGSTGVHPGVRAAFELMQISRAQELAVVIAAAGLASNLAALKALAGEGIQRGHMRLHARKAEVAAAAQPERRSGGRHE